MVLFFSIVLFVTGLSIYIAKEELFLHYLLIWICFGPVFINLFYTIEDEYYNILTWIIYLSYVVAFIEIVREKGIKDKWNKNIFLLVIVLNVYYVLISVLRGVSILDSIRYISGYTGFLVSLSIIIKNKTKFSSLLKLMKIIIVIELILALIQPYTDLLNFHAALHGDDVMTAMVNGTFVRNNVFVEFITPIVMIVFYFDYLKYKKIRPLMWVLLLVTLYITYNSGVRTVLVAIIPILVYSIYMFLEKVYKKKSTRIMVMILYGVVLYSCYVFVQNLAQENGVTYTKYAQDSSQRQAVLLSMLNDDDFAEKQTTLGYTITVLSTFPDNPIFGSGLLFQGDGYGGYISRKFGNETDATLAIFLCETGLIGLVIWVFIYYIILSKLNHKNILPKMIFVYLLIVTILDPGLFFIANVLLLFISIKMCNTLNCTKELTNDCAKRRLQKVL